MSEDKKRQLRSQAWFGRQDKMGFYLPLVAEEPRHSRRTSSTAAPSSASATPGPS